MQWFAGNVNTAIQVSRKNGALLIVYINSDDEKGRKMNDLWDQVDSTILACPVVGIRLQQGDQSALQFAEIYPTPIVPASYIIDQEGKPLEIITLLQDLSYDSFRSKINKAVENFSKKKSSAGPVSPKKEAKGPSVTVPSPAPVDPDLEEKVKRAKELLEQKKKAEAERKFKEDKEKELQRIKDMKAMQEAAQSRRDKELIDAAAQRQKEKIAAVKEKERVMAAIKADREDAEYRRRRAVAGGVVTPVEEPAKPEPPKPVPSDRCRVQVRLPEASPVVEEFPSTDNLHSLVEILKQKNHVSGNFQLAQLYPKRVFTDEELNKSFLDLALTPTCTMVIVQKRSTNSVMKYPGSGLITLLSMFLLAPFQYVWSYISLFLIGGKKSAAAEAKKNDQPSTSAASGDAQRTRRIPGEATVRRRGNVSGLHNTNGDEPEDDDKNANWNGNSTQFF
ncbi:unnamed protein product [Caenorhabditis auriculariae]|uniref:UBX domain-containing protein 4 n=1 Tax=Caenorhabditis auriculariae TaxID=2777116 RepID=A0A8S1GT21_9PELO|nr:unnamed protein product [Caenorhabditis auriculariae]